VKCKEIREKFYNGERDENLPFVVNDAVEIIHGLHKGEIAFPISIESIHPKVSYLVEMEDGSGDLVLTSDDLKIAT